MKYICLSDLHLVSKNPSCRKDNLYEKQFNKLAFVYDYAIENDCVILQAGDFFNSPRSYNVLSDFINFERNREPVDVFTIYGQHDMYYRDKKRNNLRICYDIGILEIVSGFFGDDNFSIFGHNWGDDFEAIKDDGDILLIHAPITDKQLGFYQQSINASKFLDKYNFDLIVCGDIHSKFCIEKDGRYIVNTGPVLRRSKDEYDQKPGFFVWDSNTKKIDWVEIPHDKPENVIDVSVPDFRNDEIMEEFTSAIKDIKVNGLDVQKNVIEYIKNNNMSNDVFDFLMNLMYG